MPRNSSTPGFARPWTAPPRVWTTSGSSADATCGTAAASAIPERAATARRRARAEVRMLPPRRFATECSVALPREGAGVTGRSGGSWASAERSAEVHVAGGVRVASRDGRVTGLEAHPAAAPGAGDAGPATGKLRAARVDRHPRRADRAELVGVTVAVGVEVADEDVAGL